MLWTDLEVGDILILNPEILKVSERKSLSQHLKFLKISYNSLVIRKIIPHKDSLEIYFKDNENDYWIWDSGRFWSDVKVDLFKIIALKDD